MPPELYPLSEMSLPHPSFLLPFAPLPNFYLSSYDTSRFHNSYSSSSFWDSLNLSSYNPSIPHTAFYKPTAISPSSPDAPLQPVTPLSFEAKLINPRTPPSTAVTTSASLEEEVEVTSSEEMESLHGRSASVHVSENGGDDGGSNTTIGADIKTESLVKIFIMVMKWIKTMPSFLQLPAADKKLMIAESWEELVIVAAAQWGLAVDSGTFRC